MESNAKDPLCSAVGGGLVFGGEAVEGLEATARCGAGTAGVEVAHEEGGLLAVSRADAAEAASVESTDCSQSDPALPTSNPLLAPSPPAVSLSGRYDTLAVCVLGPQGTCPQTLAAFPLSM